MLREVKTENDIQTFGKYKVDLIKYHQQYANKLGLFDEVVDKYDFNNATRNIGKDGFYQFLIIEDNEEIGILEYQIMKSEIDNKEILYIKETYRGLGIGKQVINELRKKKYRIELECWYGMPSNNMYKSMGAKEIKTRYMLEN